MLRICLLLLTKDGTSKSQSIKELIILKEENLQIWTNSYFFLRNQDFDIYSNTSRPNVFVSQRFAQMNDVANLSIIRQKGITFFLFPYASQYSCISSLSSLKSMLRETCFAGANHASSFAFWFMIKTVAVNFNPIH